MNEKWPWACNFSNCDNLKYCFLHQRRGPKPWRSPAEGDEGQVVSCCVYDFWAHLVVNLLLLKSSIPKLTALASWVGSKYLIL